MIRAGHERARRNLPDTWALRRSQPLVTLGPSGLRATVGPPRTGSIGGRPPTLDRIGGLSTGCPHSRRRPARPSDASRPSPRARRRIERADLPAKPVRTSRPPTSSAAVTTSEWATRQATVPSGSMANVSISAWTSDVARAGTTRAGRAAASPSGGPSAARRSPSRGRSCGTRRRRRAGRRCPSASARGSSWMSRGEARGPGAARALEAQLGAAQRVRVGRDQRPEVDELAARLGQGEHLGGRAAAAPPPARPQAAGIGDRRVAWLGRAVASAVSAARSASRRRRRACGRLGASPLGLAGRPRRSARPSRWPGSAASPAGPGRPPSAGRPPPRPPGSARGPDP